jgi:hypothetical protein
VAITLTTGKLVTINGVTQENDTQGVVTGFLIDFLGNTVTYHLSIGSGAPAAFNVGVYNTPISVTVNLSTGVWFSTNGFSGTISPAGLSGFISQIKGDRNLMESFSASGSGILPGVQAAWA